MIRYGIWECDSFLFVFSGVGRRTSSQRVHWWGTGHKYANMNMHNKSITTLKDKHEGYHVLELKSFCFVTSFPNFLIFLFFLLWGWGLTFSHTVQDVSRISGVLKTHLPMQGSNYKIIISIMLFCAVSVRWGLYWSAIWRTVSNPLCRNVIQAKCVWYLSNKRLGTWAITQNICV